MTWHRQLAWFTMVLGFGVLTYAVLHGYSGAVAVLAFLLGVQVSRLAGSSRGVPRTP